MFEEKSTEELQSAEKAAAKIQAGFRGYRVRKRLQEERKTKEKHNDNTGRDSEEDCQDHMDEQPRKTLEDKSATKIQAGIRGFLVRKRQQAEAAAATRIQAGFRGFRTRKLLKQTALTGSCRRCCVRVLNRMYGTLERAEDALLRMRNLAAMADQVLFFMLVDKLLLPPQQRITCLYSLMFYNVIAYCVSYVKELVTKENWSPYVTLTESSQIKHLAMSATKIVLEWTKAVTFVVTLTFTLLVFGLEQGLHNYKPSVLYTVVTWIYYLATEKVFVDMCPGVLAYLDIESLESLENLYAPVILRALAISLSAFFVLILLPLAPWRFLLLATYLNVFLRSKELLRTHWAALQKERQTLSRYRSATMDEINQFDDVCAVCLSPMKRARVTPCQHLFHASCLRQCLKSSENCPVCKRQFTFT